MIYAMPCKETQRKIKEAENIYKFIELRETKRYLLERLREISSKEDYFDKEYYINSLSKAIDEINTKLEAYKNIITT